MPCVTFGLVPTASRKANAHTLPHCPFSSPAQAQADIAIYSPSFIPVTSLPFPLSTVYLLSAVLTSVLYLRSVLLVLFADHTFVILSLQTHSLFTPLHTYLSLDTSRSSPSISVHSLKSPKNRYSYSTLSQNLPGPPKFRSTVCRRFVLSGITYSSHLHTRITALLGTYRVRLGWKLPPTLSSGASPLDRIHSPDPTPSNKQQHRGRKRVLV